MWLRRTSTALFGVFVALRVGGIAASAVVAGMAVAYAVVRWFRLRAVFEPGAVSVRGWATTEYYRTDRWAITERRGYQGVLKMTLDNGSEQRENAVLAAEGIYRWDRPNSRIERLFATAREAGFELSRTPDQWREFIERHPPK